MKLGIEKAALIRVRAGIGHALIEALDEGHCGLPHAELEPLAAPPARRARRRGPDRARAGARRGRGRGGHGRGHAVRVPWNPAPGRAGHRRAAPAHRRRQAPVAAHRRGQGAALGGGKDRPVAGAGPGRGGAAGAHVQGRRHHRRTGRGQDDHRRRHPAYPGRQGRRARAVRADRPGRPADERGHRVGGPDHPPAARARSADRRLQARRGPSHRLRPAGRRRGLDGGRSAAAGAARGGARRSGRAHRGRCRSTALGGAGPGAGRHHRLRRRPRGAAHRGLPPGGAEPDRDQRARHQPRRHPQSGPAARRQRLLLRAGRRPGDRRRADRRIWCRRGSPSASASTPSATSRSCAR